MRPYKLNHTRIKEIASLCLMNRRDQDALSISLMPGFHKIARRRRVSQCVAKINFCNQWKPLILNFAAPCDTLRHVATM